MHGSTLEAIADITGAPLIVVPSSEPKVLALLERFQQKNYLVMIKSQMPSEPVDKRKPLRRIPEEFQFNYFLLSNVDKIKDKKLQFYDPLLLCPYPKKFHADSEGFTL